MNDLVSLALHNTLLALILAVCFYGLTRVWRVPPLAHVLWLVVLLKLVAPPLVHVDSLPPLFGPADSQSKAGIARPVPRSARGQAGPFAPVNEQDAIDGQPSPQVVHGSTGPAIEEEHGNRFAALWNKTFWDRARIFVFWVWVGGAALYALVAVLRILRFEQLLKETLPAPERVQNLTKEIAGKFRLKRVPDVRYVESVECPFVWWAGRRLTILLPIRLLQQLDDQGASFILAHELAHVRRRDHWVRAIEMLVSIVHWWNPLAWAIRRQIHEAEDLCCDAWVQWAFPDCTQRYAAFLLETAESLSGSRLGPRLLPATPFLCSLSLKARIEMILQDRFAPGLSKRSLFVVGLVALAILPSFFGFAKTEAQVPSKVQTPAPAVVKPDRPSGSEFSYTVKFEQGASKLLDGDRIDITEVRGTAATFTSGNIYWIKGTYTLASRDKATLLAATTAADSRFGTGSTFKVQQANVDRGTGTFTLFLPMSCEGWPHVSFYPAKGGGDLGGTYFGTGNFVLRKWWGAD